MKCEDLLKNESIKSANNFWENSVFKNYKNILKEFDFNLEYSIDGKTANSKLFGIRLFKQFDICFVCLNMNWGGSGSDNENFVEKIYLSPLVLDSCYSHLDRIIDKTTPPTVITLIHYPYFKWKWPQVNDITWSQYNTPFEKIIKRSDFIFFGDYHNTFVGSKVLDFSYGDTISQQNEYNAVLIDFISAQQDNDNYSPAFSVLSFTDNHTKINRKDILKFSKRDVSVIKQTIYKSTLIKEAVKFSESSFEALEKVYGSIKNKSITYDNIKAINENGDLTSYLLKERILRFESPNYLINKKNLDAEYSKFYINDGNVTGVGYLILTKNVEPLLDSFSGDILTELELGKRIIVYLINKDSFQDLVEVKKKLKINIIQNVENEEVIRNISIQTLII